MSERIRVGLGPRSYDIVIGPRLIAGMGGLLSKTIGERPVVIVTDATVAGIYLPKLEAALVSPDGHTPHSVVVPAGEASKSLENYGRTAERLLSLGIDRGTVLLALGGGVVGDLAGFLAATLLRGIDFIQIPTTLLAQVDSSVGGKTAIDSAHGKNLIGAFHQPLLVVTDTDTLTSLPPRELKAGYAEIVKYALLGDPAFFDWLEENGAAVLAGEPEAVIHAIATSCRAKARIVEEDEREGGKRALLNLGHTFAHALEAESGFGDALNHGEAVAIGMVMAFDLSVRLGLCSANDLARVRSHFVRHGLPVSPPHDLSFAPRALVGRMARDKKADRGKLTFILVHAIGKAFVARDVSPSSVEAALAYALTA